MPYPSEGTLTTDIREVAIDTTWDTQTDWEAYQSASNVVINNGVVALEESTIPPAVIDDFEAAQYDDAGNSLSDYYGGDLNAFTRQQNTVSNGQYAIQGQANGVISSTSGLNRYPQQGEPFAFDTLTETDNWSSGMLFATQEESNTPQGYSAEINWGTSSLRIYRWDGAGQSGQNQLAEGSYNFNAGEFYTVEIDWTTGGDITATAYDDAGTQVDTASATDTTYTSGGIGWLQYTGNIGGSFYLDYGRVIE